MHRSLAGRFAALGVLAMLGGGGTAAQAQDAKPVAAPVPLAVGDTAPDFTLPSAMAHGAAGPISLRSLRGKTVVLAFFFKARTKG